VVRLGAGLEEGEGGAAVGVLDARLAVEDEVGGRELAEGLHQLGKLGRGVAAAPVAEANLVALAFGEDSVAVVLELEPPSGAGEGALGAGGELEVDVGQTDGAEGSAGRGQRVLERRERVGRFSPVARTSSAGAGAVDLPYAAMAACDRLGDHLLRPGYPEARRSGGARRRSCPTSPRWQEPDQ
jgi:hypothetical protein